MRPSSGTEAEVFSALSNPIRRQVLLKLRDGEKAVAEIAKEFGVGRPAISEHLQILRQVGLVREEPRGRERYYHLDPRPLVQIDIWLKAFTKYWSDRMIALEAVLEKEHRE